MSKQPISDSLRFFLTDLAAVRVKKKVSLEDIQAVTKVYPYIITQFEEEGLQGHPLFNDLYVRAFVRSYAQILGISPDEISRIYDQASKGSYRRQLAVAYLGLDPGEVEPIVEVDEEAEATIPAEIRAEDSGPERQQLTSSRRRVEFRPASREASQSSYFSGQRWLGLLREWGNKLVEIARNNGAIQWGLLVGGIGISLIVILQLLALNDVEGEQPDSSLVRSTAESFASDTTASIYSDTLQIVKEISSPADMSKPVALKDSLELSVVASTGKLDPFRVKVDDDLRRPYWLDQGDTMRFFVSDRVVVEDNLEMMQLLLEGYTYPIYRTDSLAAVVIDRDSARAFLAARYR